jgi:hypothetical protein
MKQLKILFFIAGILNIISCSIDKPIPGFLLDSSLDIFLKNSEGQDLLNTSAFNPANFKVYYLINGQKIEVNNPMMGYPRGFLVSNENPKFVRIFMNDLETELIPTTYIEWNTTDTDTIQTFYTRTENKVVYNKVWLNGSLVLGEGVVSTTPTGVGITLVK